MQSDFYIIGCGVCVGAAIGIALSVASQHASVWLPLAVGMGLAIAVAVRDRKHSGGATGARVGRSSLPGGSARADF
jgi:uncharacterized membrane protein YoaK (UPF0700 family)